MVFFGCSLFNVNSLECVSINNQECNVRAEVVDANEPIFHPFSIRTIKCSVRCNNINNPYVKLCVLDAVKELMSNFLI